MAEQITIYCKNTGNYYEVPVGSSLLDIYKIVGEPLPYRPLNAQVNNRTQDLTYTCWQPKDIEFVDMAFDGLLPALQAKKIDVIIAGMTATEDRKQFVNFSDPYYESKQTILVHRDNKDIIGFDSLQGKNVGVVLGYTGDLTVSEMSNVNVQRYGATSEAVIALKSQKVDAVVLDSEPAKQYFDKNDDLKLVISLTDSVSSEEYAIAMRKEDTELLAQINEALQTIKDNGTYDALISKYFGE